MSGRQDLCHFIAIMAREFPKGTTPEYLANLALKLIGYSKTHRRLQVERCNEPREALRARIDPKEKLAEGKIRELYMAMGGKTVVFTYEPRGCTVHLVVPSRKTNGMGQEGICVPQ